MKKNIIVISVFIVILVGTIFVTKLMHVGTTQQQSAATNTDNESYTTTPSKKSGWKTYTSKTYHFTVDYPENWVFVNYSSGADIIFSMESGGMGVFGIQVTPSTDTLQNFSTNYHPNLQVDVNTYATDTFKFIKLNGLEALQLHYGYPYNPNTQTFLIHNHNLYTISENTGSDSDQAAMLESFKFTD